MKICVRTARPCNLETGALNAMTSEAFVINADLPRVHVGTVLIAKLKHESNNRQNCCEY